MTVEGWKKWMQNQMPLIAMIFTQFVYTAMFLLSKAAISSGMKPSVFTAYRQGCATLVLAPFAYFFERNNSNCRLTSRLLCKILLVASIGVTMTLNLHYVALNHISATFATAINNTIPVMVFIIALCLRMEKVAIRKRHGIAKVLGTLLSLSGAMVFTFFKGPPIYSANEVHNSIARTYTRTEWIKGAALLLSSCLCWSFWLIMQGPILKEYPAKLRVTAIQCGFSCLLTSIYGAAVERDISSWKLGWNVNLFTLAYCGIIVTGITYTLQIWVVGKKGPLFASIFTPLPLMLTAFFSTFFFHESLYCGSVVGSVLLIAGLYSFLWGKNKEVQQIGDPPKEVAHLESIVASKSPNIIEQETRTH